MADGTLNLTLHKGLSYLRKNIQYPGKQAAADTLATTAQTRLNDVLPTGVTVSGIGAGSIKANGE